MAAGYHDSDDSKNLLVFDFGGGTLDISVVCISEGVIDVQATRGDMKLGGRDIDSILVDYCIEEFKDISDIDLNGDRKARRRLETECERVKILLSQ